MLDVWRIKKTNQIVYPLSAAVKSGYTLVLFPHKRKTNKGHRGDVRIVKDENLIKDRETL